MKVRKEVLSPFLNIFSLRDGKKYELSVASSRVLASSGHGSDFTQPSAHMFYLVCTVLVLRMAHRKWKELSNSQACCLAQLFLGAA